MLWYCATSPRSSAPWARRRAIVSSMSSTANMTRCRPSVLGGGFSGSAPTAAGVWYFVSSSLLWPSGVRNIAMSVRTPSSPTVRSAQRPSICPVLSSSMPSSVKNATAASRSSTTMATLSIRRMVMFPSIKQRASRSIDAIKGLIERNSRSQRSRPPERSAVPPPGTGARTPRAPLPLRCLPRARRRAQPAEVQTEARSARERPLREIVREVLVGRDQTARESQAERLGREHLDLRAIALEPVGMEILAHRHLFLFNPEGDCLAAKLRPGNVHSADGWEEVLLPIIDRYRRRRQTVVVRADRRSPRRQST